MSSLIDYRRLTCGIEDRTPLMCASLPKAAVSILLTQPMSRMLQTRRPNLVFS